MTSNTQPKKKNHERTPLSPYMPVVGLSSLGMSPSEPAVGSSMPGMSGVLMFVGGVIGRPSGMERGEGGGVITIGGAFPSSAGVEGIGGTTSSTREPPAGTCAIGWCSVLHHWTMECPTAHKEKGFAAASQREWAQRQAMIRQQQQQRRQHSIRSTSSIPATTTAHMVALNSNSARHCAPGHQT